MVLTVHRIKIDGPPRSNGFKGRDSPVLIRTPRSPADTYRKPPNSSPASLSKLPPITTSPTSLYRKNSFSTSSRGAHYSRATTPAYHTPDTQFSSRDRTYSHPPTSKLGSYAITNRVMDNIHIRGSGKLAKTIEDKLLETCPYELKNQPCPIMGGCRKKAVCVVGVPDGLSSSKLYENLSLLLETLCRSHFLLYAELYRYPMQGVTFECLLLPLL